MSLETQVILSGIYMNILKSNDLEDAKFYIRGLLDDDKAASIEKKYEELEQSQLNKAVK